MADDRMDFISRTVNDNQWRLTRQEATLVRKLALEGDFDRAYSGISKAIHNRPYQPRNGAKR